MANVIVFHELKSFLPSLLNRDEDGFGKQVVVGGTTRARISSQCMKRAIRFTSAINASIRTTHAEDLVEAVLNDLIAKGTVNESDFDKFGKEICELLNCKWDLRSSLGKKSKDDEGKGRTVLVATPAEITAIINAYLGADKDKKKAVEEALKTIAISTDKAMFGTMATGGVIESVDAAVGMSHAISIDEYSPENDFISATFNRGDVDRSDPFFGLYEDFANTREKAPGAGTLADSWLNSNTMYLSSYVNVDQLVDNLSKSVLGTDLGLSKEDIVDKTKDTIGDYATAFPISDPCAKQTSAASHPAPDIYYIEAIKDGNVQDMGNMFTSVVSNKSDKSVPEQGIERMLDAVSCTDFRTGDINRYVMLSAPYKKYAEDFEKLGVKVVTSLKELKEIMEAETERLSA